MLLDEILYRLDKTGQSDLKNIMSQGDKLSKASYLVWLKFFLPLLIRGMICGDWWAEPPPTYT